MKQLSHETKGMIIIALGCFVLAYVAMRTVRMESQARVDQQQMKEDLATCQTDLFNAEKTIETRRVTSATMPWGPQTVRPPQPEIPWDPKHKE